MTSTFDPGAENLEDKPNNDLVLAMFEANKNKCSETEKAVLVNWSDY